MICMVTGGAGFIGSHIVEALHEEHDVIVVDDLSAGYTANLKGLKHKLIKKDICDITEEDMKGVDIVFHNAASKKSVCLIDPKRDMMVNGIGTLNMLNVSLRAGVKKFIHASTGSVYGEPVMFPTAEDHPLRPCSYYGVSKLAGEMYVRFYHKTFGLDATVLRYFHVYGARQEDGKFGGVVAIFNRNIKRNDPIDVHGDGYQIRSFTYVKDVVEANIQAMSKGSGRIYNCVSGIKVSINSLAHLLYSLHDKKAKMNTIDPLIGDIRNFDVSNNKIVKDFGMEFNTDLKRGLEEFIYKE